MKYKKYLGYSVLILCVLVSNAFAEKTMEEKTPRAYFPENIFTFEKTLEGNEVTHDFVIENRGDAPLTVETVKTG